MNREFWYEFVVAFISYVLAFFGSVLAAVVLVMGTAWTVSKIVDVLAFCAERFGVFRTAGTLVLIGVFMIAAVLSWEEATYNTRSSQK